MSQLPLVNRLTELKKLDECISAAAAWGHLKVLCISGKAGLGKTRLLQEIEARYGQGAYPNLIIPKLIDFDEIELHMSGHLRLHIAERLDPVAFRRYLELERDLARLEREWYSPEAREALRDSASQEFVRCFNEIATNSRIVLRFDTTETLQRTDRWRSLAASLPQLRNAALFFAGRNADVVAADLRTLLPDQVEHVPLKPLPTVSSVEYLRSKERQKSITLSQLMRSKLIWLLGGHPILLDLSVEWLASGPPLPWLQATSLAALRRMPEPELAEHRRQLEEHLISQVAYFRAPRDRLITILAHAYPLEEAAVAQLMQISQPEADALIGELKQLMFVKSLPDRRIKLHDYVQDLVERVVWPLEETRGNSRWSVCKGMVLYLEKRIAATRRSLAEIQAKLKGAERDARYVKVGELRIQREQLERELLGRLECQRLQQMAHYDPGQAFRELYRLLEEVDRFYSLEYRGQLMMAAESIREELNPEQRFAFNVELCDTKIRMGEYGDALKIADVDLLPAAEASARDKARVLRLKGNAHIRLGQIREGQRAFEAALQICRADTALKDQLAHVEEALGWSYRLMTRWDEARDHYLEALRCIEGEDPLQEASLLTNLSFVQSYLNRDAADRLCQQAIGQWRVAGDLYGLGRAYSTRGCLFYHAGQYERALASFDLALEIFQPADDREWISLVRSWRGATFWAMAGDARRSDDSERGAELLKSAEQDLIHSRDIGPRRDRPMTLNRLGRVYWDEGRTDDAQKAFQESYDLSLTNPDVLYEAASLRDLAHIAAINRQFERYGDFDGKARRFTETWGRDVESFTLGGTYLFLGNLALGKLALEKLALEKPDIDIEVPIRHFQEGLALIAHVRNYGPQDLGYYLDILEDTLQQSLEPLMVKEVGRRLEDFWRGNDELVSNHPEAIVTFRRWIRGKGASGEAARG